MAAPGGRVIKPEEKGQIHVTVETLGYQGPVRHAVTVVTNDPSNANVNLTVTANVEKDIVITPPYVSFAAMPEEGIVQTVTVKNVSDKPIRLLSIQSPNNFVRVSPDAASLQPGEVVEVTIRVLYDPKLPPLLNTPVRVNTDIPYLPAIGIWVRGFTKKAGS